MGQGADGSDALLAHKVHDVDMARVSVHINPLGKDEVRDRKERRPSCDVHWWGRQRHNGRLVRLLERTWMRQE